jgi:hypothetical protein
MGQSTHGLETKRARRRLERRASLDSEQIHYYILRSDSSFEGTFSTYLRPLRSSIVLQDGITRVEQAATPALRSRANIQAAIEDDFGVFATQRALCECVKEMDLELYVVQTPPYVAEA